MILFDQIIFGPIRSRRLGLSLGVNLMPVDSKICTFDCIYCECGFNTTVHETPIPSRAEVYSALETKLKEMMDAGEIPDVITFAGNGEPTIHPSFEEIISDTIALRDLYCPTAKVSVLSNSTRIHKPNVFNALNKVDNNILKFDSAIDNTFFMIDRPAAKYINVRWLIENLKKFEGRLIIQTMFLRGEFRGKVIDNTTDAELAAWLNALEEIRPQQVMIYSLDREAPARDLQKVAVEELETIARKAREKGFDVQVAG